MQQYDIPAHQRGRGGLKVYLVVQCLVDGVVVGAAWMGRVRMILLTAAYELFLFRHRGSSVDSHGPRRNGLPEQKGGGITLLLLLLFSK